MNPAQYQILIDIFFNSSKTKSNKNPNQKKKRRENSFIQCVQLYKRAPMEKELGGDGYSAPLLSSVREKSSS